MIATLDKYDYKYNAIRINDQIYSKEHLQSTVKLRKLRHYLRKDGVGKNA